MEQNKWQLILHEQCEDPYFEITNGPISLCSKAGYVGETEDEEDEIFKKVVDALNNSGIDFHSENKLELKQHLEIEMLKAKSDRYEAALKAAQIQAIEIQENHFQLMCPNPLYLINEALSAGEGNKEVENGQ